MKYAFNIENFSLSWLKDKRMMNETRFIAGYNLKQGLLVFKLMNGYFELYLNEIMRWIKASSAWSKFQW